MFLAGGMLLLVVTAAIHRMMPSSLRRPSRLFHGPSAVLLTSSMLSLVMGAAELRKGPLGLSLVGLAVVLGVGFIALQTRIQRPLLDLKALATNHTLALALTSQALLYMNVFGSTFMLSLYLQDCLHESPSLTGRVLASATVIMAVLSPVSGRLADRTHPRLIAAIGVTSLVISASIGRTLALDGTVDHVVAVMVTQGLGFAFFSAPNLTTIMNSVPSDQTSMAAALGGMSRHSGMILGMIVTSGLMSLYLSDAAVAQDPDRFIEVIRMAYSILVGTTSAALVVTIYDLMTGRKRAT